MKFADIRVGDHLLTLEQERRSRIPIFDFAKVQKISQPTLKRVGKDESYTEVVMMTVTDSVGTYEIAVPLAAQDAIFDKVYYTPNAELIEGEIKVQQQRARQMINSVPVCEAIDAECDKILAILHGRDEEGQQMASAKPSELAELAKTVEEQGVILAAIYKSLFPENVNVEEKQTKKQTKQ